MEENSQFSDTQHGAALPDAHTLYTDSTWYQNIFRRQPRNTQRKKQISVLNHHTNKTSLTIHPKTDRAKNKQSTSPKKPFNPKTPKLRSHQHEQQIKYTWTIPASTNHTNVNRFTRKFSKK
jgi:hypothetical protein